MHFPHLKSLATEVQRISDELGVPAGHATAGTRAVSGGCGRQEPVSLFLWRRPWVLFSVRCELPNFVLIPVTLLSFNFMTRHVYLRMHVQFILLFHESFLNHVVID